MLFSFITTHFGGIERNTMKLVSHSEGSWTDLNRFEFNVGFLLSHSCPNVIGPLAKSNTYNSTVFLEEEEARTALELLRNLHLQGNFSSVDDP